MASVTVFLEAYDDAEDFDVLNRLICAWREEEDLVREQCNLPSIDSEYPGCLKYERNNRRRTQFKENRSTSVHDILLANHQGLFRNSSFVPHIVDLEAEVMNSTRESIAWEKFTQENHRSLHSYNHVDNWFNYFAMLAVRTEYYYRYSGELCDVLSFD